MESQVIIFEKYIRPFNNRFFKSIAIESGPLVVLMISSFFFINDVDVASPFFIAIFIWYSIILFSIFLNIRMHYKFELIKISLITFSNGIFKFNIIKKNKIEIKEIKNENLKLYLRWTKASRTRIHVLSIFDQNKKIAAIYRTSRDNEPEEIEYKLQEYLKLINKF